jgi:large subunit ribosomal protein L6
MSRIGNRKLVIPEGVTIIEENNVVTVKGPKGELTTNLAENITIKVEGNTLEVLRSNDNNNTKTMHGTINALINNMMTGVTKGFEKGLEIIGVGYRFTLKGNVLVISAGYSHPVEMEIPEGITVEVPSNTEVTVKGIDKVLVGEFAANIRKVRQPEPYKGKGIRYKDEHVRRKEGKKAA